MQLIQKNNRRKLNSWIFPWDIHSRPTYISFTQILFHLSFRLSSPTTEIFCMKCDAQKISLDFMLKMTENEDGENLIWIFYGFSLVAKASIKSTPRCKRILWICIASCCAKWREYCQIFSQDGQHLHSWKNWKWNYTSLWTSPPLIIVYEMMIYQRFFDDASKTAPWNFRCAHKSLHLYLWAHFNNMR